MALHTGTFLALIGSIYTAPHLPPWMGLSMGIVFASLAITQFKSGKKGKRDV